MADNTTLPENRNLLALTRPVVLVGLMGAGKTSVGRRLAREIGLEFVDADVEITEAAGCSISDIFEIYGEAIFRDLEKRVLLRLLSREPVVIATGGGAFMQEELREAVLAQGISIWLKAGHGTLLERVSRRNTRPLLEQGNKGAILERLIEERYPVYALADLTVNSNDGSHEAVVIETIKQLRLYLEATKGHS